jgi:hypothetical protein
MPARCTDPTCSCRSPDLANFTNHVLRRDAAKTDYIVIPLIGGVLANCYIADPAVDPTGAKENAGLIGLSHSVRELVADADRGEAWDETHAYGIIADLVFCNWPQLFAWGSIAFYRTTLGLPWSSHPTRDMAAAVRFLSGPTAPSWTESVIIAAIAATSASRSSNKDFALLGKSGRQLRVVLADRLRRENLITWPAVLTAAINDWTVPTLQALAHHQAKSGDAAIHYVANLEDAAKKDSPEPLEVKRSEVAELAPPAPTGEADAAEKLIEGAIVEITQYRAQRDRIQQERDRIADRDSRHRSHIESLERELQSARRSQARLESEVAKLRQESDQLAERVAGYEAVTDEAPAPAAAPDTFAGRHVLLFTGAENAGVRAAFEESFRDLGAADVTCYQADRSRGPDQFPADGIIAIDVSFMSHSTWTAIQERARAAGAWCYWGKHGAATLARATAAAWSKHLSRA